MWSVMTARTEASRSALGTRGVVRETWESLAGLRRTSESLFVAAAAAVILLDLLDLLDWNWD